MQRLTQWFSGMMLVISTPVMHAAEFSIDRAADRIVIRDGDREVCEYRFADKRIPRPYFCQVQAPSGVQVTRRHPPGDGDLDDHADFHPGIWVAFGDLSGADSWRLSAPVEHVEFVDGPRVEDAVVTYTIRNRYRREPAGELVCDEVCRWTLARGKSAYLLTMDSRFSSDAEFAFGDQEEMGLGVRLATPIAENQNAGGLLSDSEGRRSAAAVWGKQAAWSDYSGTVEDRDAGITIMAHPENFRRSWWHARNYGFVAANPFGRRAFTGGESSRVVVEPGTELRLRFRVVIHDGRAGEGFDPVAAYREYVAAEAADEQ